MSWLGVILTFSLVDNIVLSRMLGVCPCVGAPRGTKSALGGGASTAVLMSVSALAAWMIQSLILDPLGVGFLRTPAFVLSVACLAWILEALVRRTAPDLLRAAGFPVAGIAVNCAALGAALLVVKGGLGALGSLVAGLAAGAGFFIVTVLLSAIRERLDVEKVPEPLRGLPLHLISAGLLAFAFVAFDRAFLARLLHGW